VMRGWFWILVVATPLLSGCAGDPPLLDPTSGTVASQRQAAVDDLLHGARAAADQFLAGDALGVRTDTACTAGTDNWKIQDSDRSTCYVKLTTAYAVDVPALPALSGLDNRLAVAGWRSTRGGWTLTGGRGQVDGIEALNRLGYHLEDLEGITYGGPPGAAMGVRLQASATPVSTPEPAASVQPGGAYFASTEGTDWQTAWAQQRSAHPYLLLVSGSFNFARQPR